MTLRGLFPVALILDTPESSTHLGAIDAILSRLAADGHIATESIDEVRAAILHRSELGPTGIGQGVGIPHTRFKETAQAVGGVGLCRAGIADWETLDREPVHIVVLLLFPPPDAPRDVQPDLVFRHLRNEGFRQALLNAGSPDELRAALADADEGRFE